MPTTPPFPVPAKLPRKITPCPILEAVLEIRFVPSRPWDHFPGLVAQKFGAKFPKEEDTGVSQIPAAIREQDPRLTHLPYRRFVGDQFILQVGPRVAGIVTQKNTYPGWDAFWPVMSEVLDGFRDLGLMRETTRIGLRYINFFKFDIFEQLTLNLTMGDTKLRNSETGINTAFHVNGFRHFVQINNSSLIGETGNNVAHGSILDIDTSLDIKTPEFFSQAESLFKDAHAAEKAVFYGLLKPDYVASLNPEY